MKKCYSIKITGKVQSVGFRYNAVQLARQYKIGGIIKNQFDGSVYIEAEGEEANLTRFIDWCKEGPIHANVEEVSIVEIPEHGYTNFMVEYE